MEEVKKQGVESLFVPYEIALALKELGFNKTCFGYYLNGNIRLDGKIENCLSQERVDYVYTADCLAPTFSQAFRWFREEHNFDLNWKPMSMVGITFYYDIEIHHPKYVWDKPPKVTGKTYEEAELECLKKLIEIVYEQIKKKV